MTVRLFRQKGEITVFLSLILSVTLSLLCVIFESGRAASIKLQKEVAMDAALRSCFGEYNVKLYSIYDLLYIDSSYKAGNADTENVTNHLNAYMQKNLDFAMDKGSLNYFKINVLESEIEGMLLASDYNGLSVYEQAVNYLREYGDLSQIGRIQGISSMLPTTDAGDFYGEWDMVLSQIAAFSIPFYNPSEVVRGLSSAADLQLIGARSKVLSSLSYGSVPSKRSLREGNYKISASNNNLLFTEYLRQKCGSFARPKEYSHLSCELEYLIYGFDTDVSNVKAVINRLIRIFSNNIYESLGSRVGEMKAYAEILVPPPVVPEDPASWAIREELVNLTASSLRYAWAETEAILKVDRLLGGGRVSALNPSSEMISSLLDMPAYPALLGGSGGSGYTYEEYLCAFILSADMTQVRRRFLDILEINIKKSGSKGFEIDGALEYLKARVLSSSIGREYHITREYAYEKKYIKP